MERNEINSQMQMNRVQLDTTLFRTKTEFNNYWDSLELTDHAQNAGTEIHSSMMSLFMEIQRLGISITDKSNKPFVSRLINEFFDGKLPNREMLREALIAELSSDYLSILINKEYFRAITSEEWAFDDAGNFGLMRDGLFYELGLRYPKFKLRFTDALEKGLYKIQVNDSLTEAFSGIDANECLVNDTVERIKLLRINGTPTVNPANGSQCAIIAKEDVAIAKQAGLSTWDPMGYLTLCFSSVLRNYAACFVNNKLVHDELDRLSSAWPKLVEVLKNKYPIAIITKTLRLLLSEEVSIRNLRLICMSMLDMDYIKTDPKKYIILDDRLPVLPPVAKNVQITPQFLAEYVRSTMKDYLTHKYSRGGNTLVVYLLDPAIEEMVETSITENQRLSVADQDKLVKALELELGNLSPTAQNPVLLTYTAIRSTLKELLRQRFPRLAVVAYNELAPTINIQPIARISMK
ncbi:FHIPEP family type III secretion protein [Flavobacteriaceae bacterium TP-CH-4]|uniref:FHIPEP family type III secretion protein n=1 Tax=Pelagihabitans pacificus TaxID=2696054 RepID=A0A967AQC9_9FLAO|nr:FHIPEP family type III secretion protein [Pelagihabitans pacificus]NHF58042.1 FHIPEP family type III secretion protein [Pelagihabitans pacificus]